MKCRPYIGVHERTLLAAIEQNDSTWDVKRLDFDAGNRERQTAVVPEGRVGNEGAFGAGRCKNTAIWGTKQMIRQMTGRTVFGVFDGKGLPARTEERGCSSV